MNRGVFSRFQTIIASGWYSTRPLRASLLAVGVGYAAASVIRFAGQLGTDRIVLVNAWLHRPELYVCRLVIEIGSMILGGYVTLRLSRRHHLRHASLFALLYGASIVAAICFFSDNAPIWFRIALSVSPGPASFAGGYLWLATLTRICERDERYGRVAQQAE